MSRYLAHLAAQRSRHLEELLDFLRIPSISALPAHRDDVARAASWVADRLRRAGLAGVQIMPTADGDGTPGHPVVYGEWLEAPGKPTVLLYGHFDVQPVDPEHLWTTPPFAPTVRDGRVYARGASDMKGNLLVAILAVEALLQADGGLPLNVKFLCEGQEEIGSPQLPAWIQAHRDLLAADLAVSFDGSLWSEEQPLLLLGLRGLCAIQVDVQGARGDLHSGMAGGTIQNPLQALAHILAGLRSPDGRVLVAGFYDQVRPLMAADRAQIAAVPWDDEAYRAELGVPALVGEPGYTTLERRWARPTLDVNGIWGGFQGQGIKTVLPNQAHAKITCRLVPDQEPQEVIRLLAAHVEQHAPPGVTVSVTPLPGRSRPYRMPAGHPANRAAHAALEQVYSRAPLYTRAGFTVPAVEMLQRYLGLTTVTFGFGCPDENIHAPDEFWRLGSFDRGLAATCAYLAELASAL